eukprot:964892-Prorocentrum_minimum.AAC.4
MHSQEKPQKPPAPTPSAQAPIPVAAKPIVSADTSALASNDPKLTCNRCRQGFFCSDHAAIPGVSGPFSLYSTLLEPFAAPATDHCPSASIYYGYDLPRTNITSFHGSSCANNGKGALNTPDASYQCFQHRCGWHGRRVRSRAGGAAEAGPRPPQEGGGPQRRAAV